MAMKKLSELFIVTYGNKLDLNKMQRLGRAKGGVNFVGRSGKNNGVSGTVATVPDMAPYEAGLLTVALGGSFLSSFVQEAPFYTAQNVAVLKPKKPLTQAQKVYACMCIRQNRFRYSAFGREANRTLRDLPIPEPVEFPDWLADVSADTLESKAAPAVKAQPTPIEPRKWKPIPLSQLFEIKKGKRLTKADMQTGATPFVGAIFGNNGVVGGIGQKPHHPGNTITVCYNGAAVGEAFYQPAPFWASDDVNVLYPKFALTPPVGIFLATVIRQEKYRFSYGRKWHLGRMEETTIRVPCKADGTPDFPAMEKFVLALPFSSQIATA